MLTARYGGPRRPETGLGIRNVSLPASIVATTQPATRQSWDQTREIQSRPKRFKPLANIFTRKSSDPAPPHPSPLPPVDSDGSPLAPAHAHLPTGPAPVAAPARQESVPLVQLMSRLGSGRSTSQRPSTGANRQDGSPDQDEADEEGGSVRSSKRFLLCFPSPKSRQVRAQARSCVISGIFTLALLGVYIGLTQKNILRQGELTILIALVILGAGAFFGFSAVRLWLAIFRPEREDGRRVTRPENMVPGRYVVPPKPIPVLLARDEEAVGAHGQAVRPRPPAYGLWCQSVRLDPNRLFWQRNQASPAAPEGRIGRRPPSYSSEDGISYVVEARPRSMLPPPGPDVFDSMQRPANQVDQRQGPERQS